MLKDIILPSTKRVELNTSRKINKRIEQRTLNNINKYKDVDYKKLLDRIRELNREWDTERVLEANASLVILISSILGFIKNIRWFIIVIIVSFFLLLHAIYGWCPPVPIIRRLGIRTPEEIQSEKTVLKVLNKNGINNKTNAEALYIEILY